MDYLLRFWHWLTTTRYTRLLEENNKELHKELQQWQSALLESVNLPRIVPREQQQQGALPQMGRRRLTPSQWIREVQKATIPKEPENVETKKAG